MITTFTDGETLLTEGGTQELTFEAIEAIDKGSREHLSLWCTDIDKAYLKMFGRTVKDGFSLSAGNGGLLAAHGRRTHIRDSRAYFDKGVDSLQDLVRKIGSLSAELIKLGGSRLYGTAASAAHELWKTKFNPPGWYRAPFEEIQELDFQRSALYGGRTEAESTGLFVCHGEDVPTVGGDYEVQRLPEDHRIFRIDQRSAYPAAMLGQFPGTWSGITEGFDLSRKFGICRVTLSVNTEGPRVIPIRVRVGKKVRTIWPKSGEVCGVYTYTLIREAIKYGAKIVKTGEARTFELEYYPLRSFVRRVWSAHQEIDDSDVRGAIKALSRKLYGKFGMSRFKTQCLSLKEYLEDLNGLPFPRVVLGDHVMLRMQEDKYPVWVQPVWSAIIADRVVCVLGRVEEELRAGGARILYRDTDSVTFSALEKNGEPQIGDHIKRRFHKDLGGWKIDHRSGPWGLFLGSKTYALKNETKLAGVPNDIQEQLLYNSKATFKTAASVFSESRTIHITLKEMKNA